MSEPRKPPFPAWLDRVRRRDARRWAKMTPEEIAADINCRGEKAEMRTVGVAARGRHRTSSHGKVALG